MINTAPELAAARTGLPNAAVVRKAPNADVTAWASGLATLSGFEGKTPQRSLAVTGRRRWRISGAVDALAGEAQREDKPCVVVLDNAPFHTARVLREREEEWEKRGLTLYRLPAYCPHLNPIEGAWRRLKGFLMPRRFYDSVAELKRAVLHALHLLGAVEVQHSLGDT